MFENLIAYFQTLESRPLERLLFLVFGMLVLWAIEGAIPLLSLRYRRNKFNHAAINFSFTTIHLIIHTGFAVLIILLSDWCKANNFGLIHWLNASIGLAILITILTLDFFGGWLVHFTEHKFAWLWRFHIVHHADNNVDVTTGLRHHPVESVLRGVFFLAGVVVAGAPMYAVMIFQTVLVLFVQFTHANIRLPRKVDRLLSYVLVSPNMHKVHHHWKQPYTDSNYGAVFSIWDRLLGTFMTLEPHQIRYGLDRYYPNEKDEDFVLLMKKPFENIYD
ncbi:sterol desaturase family protein [Segetibacter sp. 3557_3]|uniref:sterol desaturase family protein n=1 Tax=Segetibacter sp. 3557_3 TaxID=2547429 RepID=UPI001058C92D|nr:sterol desaturase family protein [Segetibacter sp. 3557_3]TDH25227.1 sterol desaturase family protein [Segetibacter sp. 3557_3]